MANKLISGANICPVCEAVMDQPAGKVLRTTQDVLSCLNHFRSKKQEYFICLSLDGQNRLIAWRVVTIGTLNASLVHPREIFAGPITDRATSVVIVHNHPSGETAPSREDIKTTQQLVAAGLLLAIPLRDHIILTSEGYYSFKKCHLI